MKALADGSLYSSGYGAPELRQCYQRYMSRSLVLSITLQLACVASLYVVRAPEVKIEPNHPAIIIPYRPQLPLPFIQTNFSSGVINAAKNLLRSKYAIPVPVTYPVIDSNVFDLASRRSGGENGQFEGVSDSGVGSDIYGIPGEDEFEPAPFKPVEKMPEIVKRVEPRYPEIAARAGIQGTVYLKLWIDSFGKVRKTVVLKSDAQILDSSAEDAAKQWIFTPAIMQHAPVSIWVSIPFRFKLVEK